MADIKTLKPYIAWLFTRLVEEAAKKGYKVLLVSAYRSIQEQTKIYAQGRTTPGPIISYAAPGHSMHNYRLAFDVAVIDMKTGKETFEGYMVVGQIGKSFGLTWGYDFIVNGKPFHDKPHFQWTGGLTDGQVFGGKMPVDPYEAYEKTSYQYKDNYQAEINRLKASTDPLKDMKIYILNQKRDAKIAAQKKG